MRYNFNILGFIMKKLHFLVALTGILVFICALGACSLVNEPDKSYTITFDGNGATTGTAPGSQSARAGSAITIPPGTGLEKTGSTFGGWNTRANGSGTDYAAGTTITVQTDMKLYAKWTAVSTAETPSYTVTFSHNYTGCPAPSAQTGVSIAAPAEPTRGADWKFVRWETGRYPYSLGRPAVVFPFAPSRDITLYAHWDYTGSAYYNVKFDLNVPGINYGMDGGWDIPAGSSLEDKGPIPIPEERGLSFSGWFFNKDGTGELVAGAYKPQADIVLYGKWAIQYYTIYLIKDFGYDKEKENLGLEDLEVFDHEEMRVDAGKSLMLPLLEPREKDNFIFSGWYCKWDFSEPAGSFFTPSGAEPYIYLFAKWSRASP
jgi:hypothetical protein